MSDILQRLDELFESRQYDQHTPAHEQQTVQDAKGTIISLRSELEIVKRDRELNQKGFQYPL